MLHSISAPAATALLLGVSRTARDVLEITFELPPTGGSIDIEAEFPEHNRPTFGLAEAFDVAP